MVILGYGDVSLVSLSCTSIHIMMESGRTDILLLLRLSTWFMVRSSISILAHAYLILLLVTSIQTTVHVIFIILTNKVKYSLLNALSTHEIIMRSLMILS